MSKKLLQILRMVTKGLGASEMYTDEVLDAVQCDDPDLLSIVEELAAIETSGGLGEDELDILKSLLVYILIRKSSFEKEEVYSLVFGEGKRILWN